MVGGPCTQVTSAQRKIIEACVAENTGNTNPIREIQRRTGLTRGEIEVELRRVSPGQPYNAETAQEIYDRMHPSGGIIQNEPLTRRFVDPKIREGLTDYQIELELIKEGIHSSKGGIHARRTIATYRAWVLQQGLVEPPVEEHVVQAPGEIAPEGRPADEEQVDEPGAVPVDEGPGDIPENEAGNELHQENRGEAERDVHAQNPADPAAFVRQVAQPPEPPANDSVAPVGVEAIGAFALVLAVIIKRLHSA